MERNVKQIIREMTLEEKAGMCSGKDNWYLKAVERLGVPHVMVADGPHGLRKQEEKSGLMGLNGSIQAVCFPAACATAASFDEGLLERLGEALGEECRAENVSVILGPAVNIKRSPLCGRNFEYFSEDPYLAGKLSAAQIRGVQKWDVGTSLKHFAANNQEYRRMSCSSNMSERTLREIYLRAFEIAVKEARPWTLMCSYNKINGEYASENHFLLTEILRDEWGFDGYVMSDWGAVNDRVKGLKAGLDLEMPSSGGVRDRKIVEAVKSGALKEEVLDLAVERIFNIVFRYVDAVHPEAVFDRVKHHCLAAEMEKECAVLLKNESVLPLQKEQRVVYIGGFAKHPRYQGGGSSHINPARIDSACEAAKGKRNVFYTEGFPADSDVADSAKMDEAVSAAREADVAVIFAGLPDSYESEGYDREHLHLPACQNELIHRIAEVQKNTVVVLHIGSPVNMPWSGEVGAILNMYLGGEGVGAAADALLYGEANPCGRLPETFPVCLEYTPAYLNFPGDGENVDYQEGVYVGYRYYDAKKLPVLYPFGFGLSYTEFTYDHLRISVEEYHPGETLTVSVDVTNTGNCAGKEVVQFYVSDKTGTPGRPLKELRAFQKVELQPGETKTVTVSMDERAFQWYHEGLKNWYAASGTYQIHAARSSADICQSADILYSSDQVLPLFVTENTTVAQLLAHPVTAPAVQQMLSAPQARQAGAGEESEAISKRMLMEMIQNSPLRALMQFGILDEPQMLELIEKLNGMLGEA